MSDFSLLLQSTVKLYTRALMEVVQGLKSAWWLPLAYLGAAAVLTIPLGIVAGLLGIVGSFIAGLLLAFIIAMYLASLRAVVRKESFSGLLDDAKVMFFPVIHVLFVFFVVNLLLGLVVPGPQKAWILACVGIGFTIFGNVLPELIYVRGSAGAGIFTESFEFILENWVEWFLPAVPFVLILFTAMSLHSGMYVTIQILQNHPLAIVQSTVFRLGALAWVPAFWPTAIATAYILHVVALFRAALFESLLHSTRRKRIYAERTGQ